MSHAEIIEVSHADNYFLTNFADRRGRSCAGPQTMFDIFLKEVGTLFVGRHKTGPCEAAEDGVAIFNIFKIRVKLMSRHFSWLEMETVLSFVGFATDKVEIT